MTAVLLVQGELAEERRAAQGGRGADVAPDRPAAEADVRPGVAQRHAGQRRGNPDRACFAVVVPIAGLLCHPRRNRGSKAWPCAGAGVGAQLRWHQLP